MTKRIAISQSNYVPWKGYFDLIQSVDQFVLYDEVQYTRRDWRNRNRIRTPQGLSWLTIPVLVKGKYVQTIEDTAVSDPTWSKRHWASICHSYSRGQYFDEYSKPLRTYLEGSTPDRLSQINRDLLEIVMGILRITTPLTWSSEFPVVSAGKSARLVSICQATEATTYVSGPAARGYLDVSLFEKDGIAVEWFNYDGYPEYQQLHSPFVHEVSIIDLVLNTGPEARDYLLGGARR